MTTNTTCPRCGREAQTVRVQVERSLLDTEPQHDTRQQCPDAACRAQRSLDEPI